MIIRSVYALCLFGATFNHVRAIIAHGIIPAFLPLPSAVYWSSLTLLDPLAAVLLFVRPRLGIILTAVIIVSNVVHNLWFTAEYDAAGLSLEMILHRPFLLMQLLFLVFVGLTAPIAWRSAERRSV